MDGLLGHVLSDFVDFPRGGPMSSYTHAASLFPDSNMVYGSLTPPTAVGEASANNSSKAKIKRKKKGTKSAKYSPTRSVTKLWCAFLTRNRPSHESTYFPNKVQTIHASIHPIPIPPPSISCLVDIAPPPSRNMNRRITH